MDIPLYLSFDDILILPGYSDVKLEEVDLRTRLTRGIEINIPIVSAAMDTVSEAQMAIELAKFGGISIIHRNMTIDEQCMEVRKVKKYESWIVQNPITLPPDASLREVKRVMEENQISGIIVVKGRKVVGIITRRDISFEKDLSRKVSDVMTKRVITAREGISLEEAKEIMIKNKIEKLPVVDGEGNLKGLITLKDIKKAEENPLALKDRMGRLMVGAAIGVGEKEILRAEKLIEEGVDVIVVDSAHGHTKSVIETIQDLKRNFSIDVIGGNVATADGAEALAKAGADAIKVGVGPGSICTTRMVTGVGAPQISAIMECAKIGRRYDIPIIADGGIRYTGDIAKAIAVGADSVMLGNMLAGTDESPGEKIMWNGKPHKVYRGMGSEDAIKEGIRKGVRSRYMNQENIIPEGVVGIVPYKGSVREVLRQIIGALKAALGYVGARNIKEFKANARIIRITEAGYRESQVHDVYVIKEPLFEK